MSVGYQAVGWNRTKKIYDGILASGLVVYLGVFVGIGSLVHPNATAETLLICGLGTAALLLHIILCIGPLCRLDRRFLPLLYNRRHLGVTMFVLALAHSAFSTFQFHALGNINPLVSLFASNTRYTSVADFPFQALGFLALAILFLMAATSHDFWLHNLTAPVWKRLHMFVFVAYRAAHRPRNVRRLTVGDQSSPGSSSRSGINCRDRAACDKCRRREAEGHRARP